MRERRRYIAFEITKETNTSELRQVINFFQNRTPKSEQSVLRLMFYNERSRRGLLRCGHRQVDGVKTSMLKSGKIFRVLGVSGTIRAAKRKFLADG
ncbi:MAG TPA: hypothetical protein EYP46_01055 [Hadesarchaea archaeon]|nr:hypothetical protein [Hadesarchaea archaeon]